MYDHFPNLVFVGEVFKIIDDISCKWKRPVKKIVHDEQSQFKEALLDWHSLHSNPALPKTIKWVCGEEFRVRKVEGSEFHMERSDRNVGIQISDVCLWILKKSITNNIHGPARMLLEYVLSRMSVVSFSDEAIRDKLENYYKELYETDITQEQFDAGKKWLESSEEHRQNLMRETGLVIR